MQTVKIGTRGSRLALAQAELAAGAFRAAGFAAEIKIVRTRGDEDIRSSLAEIGRGAFTDVFSDLIARGEIDVAVHSAKDLPTGEEKDGFFCLPRADARDALVRVIGREIRTVGTGSPRRAAAVSRLCPGAKVLPVRGNVDTRIEKMLRGEFDALILAQAGLDRLGFSDSRVKIEPIPPELLVPAACQGIIAVEGEAGRFVADEAAGRAAQIERACQRALGGSCTGGAGAYFDGAVLYAQLEGRIAQTEYGGAESVALLAGRFA